MRRPRVRLAAACLLAAGCGACGGPATHPRAAGAHRVGDLDQPRAAHTATTLADGRVLVAGGFGADEGEVWASTEVFDRAAGRFRSGPTMLAARQSHTATRLRDGRVLIAGGYGADGRTMASAELFDPATRRFAATGRMAVARAGQAAVLLRDGTVLVAGGEASLSRTLASAEIYDPATGRFVATGAMSVARTSHTATVLPDGRVLVAGGHRGRRRALRVLRGAELYDPATGAFTPTGALRARRHKHDAVTLADGRVLVIAGADERDDLGAYHSAEIYDPRNGAFAPTGALAQARYKLQGTSIALMGDTALVTAGAARPELFDARGRRFRALPGSFGAAHLFAAAAPVGRGALVTGGYTTAGAATADAWLVTP
jgi:Galactose oxidase, central domain